MSLGQWNCLLYDLGPWWDEVESPALNAFKDISAWLRDNGRRDGQPVLIVPDGRPVSRVEAFSPLLRVRAHGRMR